LVLSGPVSLGIETVWKGAYAGVVGVFTKVGFPYVKSIYTGIPL